MSSSIAYHREQELADHLPGVCKALRLAKHVYVRIDIPISVQLRTQ
jgi:hypothetical protein